MKKNLYILFLALSLLLSSCGDSPDVPATAHRTVLVYMAANNSLGNQRYDELDLNEMQDAARNGDLGGGHLMVFRADIDGNYTLSEITDKGIKTVKTYSSSDGLTSVHAKRMSSVIDDVKTFAPADSYGLILWSHGMGWLQDGISDDFEPKAKSWGEDSRRTMNITSLRNALTGKDLDFVYFDCCYMASVEVAYELRKVTPYIIASAIELPAEGMRYDLNIAPLFAKGKADLIGAARNTFNHYDSRLGAERTCAMSVIATAGLDNLASASRAIYRASGGKTPADFLPQRFMTESNCWFFDMAQYYRALAANSEDKDTLLQEWNKSLEDCVVYEAATPRVWNRLDIEHHCGLSTYILNSTSENTTRNYNTLSWYNDVISQ